VARNPLGSDNGFRRKPGRVRSDHHVRIEYSWPDPHAAACDLQRFAGAIDLSVRRGTFLLEARLAIERPGITALFGPSGAGKTSLIHAVAGLAKAERGKISLNGRTVLDTEARIDVPSRARRVGYVFQDARLFPHMSVERNLLFGWRRAPAPATSRDVAQIVGMLGLDPLRARNPRTLSGGERQRVAIGRALLASPEMLLLDEPMASLDLARREEILPYLERLRDERRLPMLYVTHAIEEVARLADEVVVLNNGRVTDHGSVFDVIPRIDPKAGTVLPVTVIGHREDGLTELESGAGTLLVQRIRAKEGTALRVRIAATDVMLSLRAAEGLSANNVIPAKIVGLRHVKGFVDVELAAGSARLVARITEASTSRLALVEGTNVFAIVKAVTVDTAMASSD
jgi:molybdate transport system ATP-binding protein